MAMKINKQVSLENTKAYFNRIAGEWSSHYSEAGLMGDRIHRFTEAIEVCVNPYTKILDFGCGSGELARAIAEKGWSVKGCDVSEEMLWQAAKASDQLCIEWILLKEHSDIKLPFNASSLDVILASSVFEYLPNPEIYLREFYRILSNDGCIFFSVPDMRHPLRVAEEAHRRNLFLRAFRRIWNLSVHGKDTDYLKYSITRYYPDEWVQLLKDCSFNPSPISVLSEPLLLLQAKKGS